MSTSFNLKKFLVENKLTTNSRLVNEEVSVPDMNNSIEVEAALVEFNEIISDNFADGNARHSIYDGVEEVANILSDYYGPEHKTFITYAIENSPSDDEDEDNVLKAAFNQVVGTNFKFELSGIDFKEKEEGNWMTKEADYQLGYKYFLKYKKELEEKGLLDADYENENLRKAAAIAHKIKDKLMDKGELEGNGNLFAQGFLKDF